MSIPSTVSPKHPAPHRPRISRHSLSISVPPRSARFGVAVRPCRAARAKKAQRLVSPSGIIYRNLSDVEPKEIPWLWPGRIPRGMLTLIIGDPDQGKSYMTLDLSARVSTGGEWPDGGKIEAGNVILLAAEDHASYVIRPRMDKLGGDPSRIVLLDALKDEGSGERLFSLEKDVDRLGDFIKEMHAPLAVIDPLNNYVGSKTDSYKDPEVRAILMPLARVAEQTDAAILGLMHLTKDKDRAAIHRVLGSVGFIGVARVALAVAKDLSDPSLRVFGKTKMNIAGDPPCLGFRIDDVGLHWEAEPVEADMEALLKGMGGGRKGPDPTERERAISLLKEMLTDGVKVEVKEADRLRREAGIAQKTWERARTDLGVKSERIPWVSPAVWVIYLPQATAPPQ